jgi:hypothetical protein
MVGNPGLKNHLPNVPKLARLLLFLYLLGGVTGVDALVWCIDQGGYAHLEQSIAESNHGKLGPNPVRFQLYKELCQINAGATHPAAGLKHLPVLPDQIASAFGIGHQAAPVASSAVPMVSPLQRHVSAHFEIAGEFSAPATKVLRTTVLLI